MCLLSSRGKGKIKGKVKDATRLQGLGLQLCFSSSKKISNVWVSEHLSSVNLSLDLSYLELEARQHSVVTQNLHDFPKPAGLVHLHKLNKTSGLTFYTN